MSILDNLEYDKNFIYDDSLCYKGLKQRIYLQKSHMKANNVDQFFLKAYVIDNSALICQGYIYFYLNPLVKTSDFIGVYIKPKYRNNGLASLLVSVWIQFCLNNNYNFLGTIKTQRKPFLIYLLKTYGFEILDNNIYKVSRNVIDICRKNDEISNTKYLLFKNSKQKESFMSGNIAKEDNYKAIDNLDENMSYLGSVILSKKYDLKDEYTANEKSNLVLNRYKR